MLTCGVRTAGSDIFLKFFLGIFRFRARNTCFRAPAWSHVAKIVKMGVIRGRRGEAHHIRHSLTRMFASGHEAGKGLYIGGEDVPPPQHQHRHHTSAATTSATATTAASSRHWRSSELDTAVGDLMSSDASKSVSSGSGHYISSQHSARSLHVGSSVSPPSSSSSAFYPNTDLQNADSPYMESLQSPTGIFGHAHSRHNMSHVPAHSLAHPIPNRQGSLLTSSSPAYSNTNLANLEVDHTSTVSPLQAYRHIQALDPLPTALEMPWNLTDTLCFNRTTASYECWDLFNPDENDTTTQSSVTGDDEYRYWTLVLIIIPLLTVFGNVLVVMSVIKEKSLKTVTNYFICSLAVADIMVAVIVMSFAVYMEVSIQHTRMC